jgi:hypothetical protein
MSKGLARAHNPARANSGPRPRVPIVPLVPIGAGQEANGTKDTNGTRAEIDLEERIAMALEGGVPPSTLPPSLRSYSV